MLPLVSHFALLWQNCPQVPSQQETFAVEFVFFSERCSFLDEAQESPLTVWILDSIDICIHLEIRTLSHFFKL